MMCKVEYKGLCVNCMHQEYCMYCSKDECVTRCEEFEIKLTLSSNLISESGNISDTVYNEDAPPGLCRTCENFKDCTFPKPASGKWFCEEFK